MGKSPTLLFLFLISISLLLISLVSKTTPPRPPKISHSTNLHNPFHPPPKIAYFNSTSDGDGPRTVRLLSAFYHPSNRYLLHLDRRAAQAKRDDLAGVVGAVDAFTAAGNVNVFGNADPLNIEGPTAVAAVLRGAAVLMRRWKDWDWFDCTRCCHLSFVALRGLGLDRKGWLSFTCRAAARDGFEGGNLFSGGSFKGSENRSIFDGFDESGAASFGTLSAEITPETVDFFVSEAEGDPDCPSEGFSSIDQAIDALRQGKFVIAVDDENGDEEGDLIMAASLASSRALAFMIRHGSGIVSVGMKEEDLERLSLPLMSTGSENEDPSAAAYTVTVDLKTGASTGVSASDRAKTILALSSPDSKPQDFRRPGHVFPLEYRNGGVLRRAGHTEASVDLVSLAGLPPVSVLSAILDAEDGSMARLLALRKIAKENSIPIISITDLIRYRRKRERLVERTAVSGLPTKWGNFQAYCYLSKLDGTEHVAIVKGDIGHGQDVLVRVHSECLTGDIFGSARCDCGNQLALAMQLIEEAGRGVLVYLRGHEGRGIGLGHKLRAYNLQDLGHDTVEANLELGLAVDAREYGIGAQILRDIGVRTMRLMTNNPAKFIGLKGYGLAVVGRVPVLSPITEENWRYLETKRTKMGHVYGSDLPGSITGFGKPIVNNTDQAKEGQTD